MWIVLMFMRLRLFAGAELYGAERRAQVTSSCSPLVFDLSLKRCTNSSTSSIWPHGKFVVIRSPQGEVGF